MTDPTSIRVELGAHAYDVHIGPGLLDAAGVALRELGLTRPAIIVTEPAVAEAGHLDRLQAGLAAADVAARTVLVPGGEASKSLERFAELAESILELGVERATPVIALGGGVIGDLAGFAAATLLRGLPLVQVPTTLLAQVDSSVGGKTGVNSRLGKNLIGSFHQPRLVLADLDTLTSLPTRELRAGYAEIVKYGVLGDAAFFGWLEANGAAVLAGEPAAQRHAVAVSCAAKAAIVAADERETSGRRALLNLGHTFAHAFEALGGYDGGMLHGDAVACGMVLATELSARLSLCPPADAARVRRHLAAVELPVSPAQLGAGRFDTEAVIAAMARDKKVKGGKIALVLVRGIGQAFLTSDVDLDNLRALLAVPAAA